MKLRFSVNRLKWRAHFDKGKWSYKSLLAAQVLREEWNILQRVMDQRHFLPETTKMVKCTTNKNVNFWKANSINSESKRQKFVKSLVKRYACDLCSFSLCLCFEIYFNHLTVLSPTQSIFNLSHCDCLCRIRSASVKFVVWSRGRSP